MGEKSGKLATPTLPSGVLVRPLSCQATTDFEITHGGEIWKSGNFARACGHLRCEPTKYELLAELAGMHLDAPWVMGNDFTLYKVEQVAEQIRLKHWPVTL
jgi:hypothetical protein